MIFEKDKLSIVLLDDFTSNFMEKLFTKMVKPNFGEGFIFQLHNFEIMITEIEVSYMWSQD